MKAKGNQWIAAVCILAGIVLVIICCHFYLNRVTDGLAQTLTSAENAERAGNDAQTQRELEAFNRQWMSHREFIATMIRHSEIDLVNQSAAKLKAYAKGEDKAQFFAECDTLQLQIKHLYDVERFSWGNIL